jgi:hypothetical protein
MDMSDFSNAKDLIRGAEAGLRDIMQAALAQERYSDLAEVAPLASALSNLLQGVAAAATCGNTQIPSVATTEDTSRQIVPRALVARQSRPNSREKTAHKRDDEYPRFEQDGDKLVKVGWSKKDRAEYEHRAPKETVFRIAEILNSTIGSGKVFAMDRVMPFKNIDGSEIPSYQAYLALAWFRMLGAVQERGKEGYVVVNGKLDASRLDDAWKLARDRN